MREATRIFAIKGYAQASTREICLAAQANVAAIHYHFGGKAGLYRGVLAAPLHRLDHGFETFDAPQRPLAEALRGFIGPLLCPERGGDPQTAWRVRLHLREMVEPTHDPAEDIAQWVMPWHTRLLGLLARHIGPLDPHRPGDSDDPDPADTLAAVASDLHPLAFALSAMVHDYGRSREGMQRLAPGLLEGPQAMERILDRLVGYALALVAHERARRTMPQPSGDPSEPSHRKALSP